MNADIAPSPSQSDQHSQSRPVSQAALPQNESSPRSSSISRSRSLLSRLSQSYSQLDLGDAGSQTPSPSSSNNDLGRRLFRRRSSSQLLDTSADDTVRRRDVDPNAATRQLKSAHRRSASWSQAIKDATRQPVSAQNDLSQASKPIDPPPSGPSKVYRAEDVQRYLKEGTSSGPPWPSTSLGWSSPGAQSKTKLPFPDRATTQPSSPRAAADHPAASKSQSQRPTSPLSFLRPSGTLSNGSTSTFEATRKPTSPLRINDDGSDRRLNDTGRRSGTFARADQGEPRSEQSSSNSTRRPATGYASKLPFYRRIKTEAVADHSDSPSDRPAASRRTFSISGALSGASSSRSSLLLPLSRVNSRDEYVVVPRPPSEAPQSRQLPVRDQSSRPSTSLGPSPAAPTVDSTRQHRGSLPQAPSPRPLSVAGNLRLAGKRGFETLMRSTRKPSNGTPSPVNESPSPRLPRRRSTFGFGFNSAQTPSPSPLEEVHRVMSPLADPANESVAQWRALLSDESGSKPMATGSGFIFGKPLRQAVLHTRLMSPVPIQLQSPPSSNGRTLHHRSPSQIGLLDLGSQFSLAGHMFVDGDTTEDSVAADQAIPPKVDSKPPVDRMMARRQYLPRIVTRCIEALETYGPQEEGIYRLSGRTSHTNHLRSLFDGGLARETLSGEQHPWDLNLKDLSPAECDINSVCSVLKAYLRDLPQNILGRRQIEQLQSANRQLRSEAPPSDKQWLETILSDLQPWSWYLLRELIYHLEDLTDPEVTQRTKMNMMNLTLVLSPTLSVPGDALKVLVEQRSLLFRQGPPEDYELDHVREGGLIGGDAAAFSGDQPIETAETEPSLSGTDTMQAAVQPDTMTSPKEQHTTATSSELPANGDNIASVQPAEESAARPVSQASLTLEQVEDPLIDENASSIWHRRRKERHIGLMTASGSSPASLASPTSLTLNHSKDHHDSSESNGRSSSPSPSLSSESTSTSRSGTLDRPRPLPSGTSYTYSPRFASSLKQSTSTASLRKRPSEHAVDA